MREPRFASLSGRLLAFVFPALVIGFLIFGAEPAAATVTVVQIDPNSISATTGTGTATTIFGGVTGSYTGAPTCDDFVAGSVATCDNCANAGTNDAALIPCNKRRIHPDARVHLRISSDTTDGYPIITVVNGTSQQKVTSAITESSVAKTTVADIYVRWGDLCGRMTVLGGVDASCSLTVDEVAATINVGFDSNNDGQLVAGTDDFTNMSVKVRDGVGATSLQGSCGSNPTYGLCYWEVRSGDKKFSIVNPSAVSGFPLANGTSFRFVRVLFVKRSSLAAGFEDTNITAGSDYADLEITGTTPSISLDPNRVVGLENDQAYDVKIALVDQAGNTGYYTSTNQREDCNNASSINPGNAARECHVARPSEVVGILSEQTNCFVATAAYGTPFEKEVSTLRAFRDRFLVPTMLGKKFVRWYYDYGPLAAEYIVKDETRRTIARAALALPLAFAKFALREGGLAAAALLSLIFGAPLIVAIFSWIRRKRGVRV